jgi:hypothetical protein
MIIGAIIYKIKLDLLKKTVSFKINFKPSAKACKIPQKPTTLGPRRL